MERYWSTYEILFRLFSYFECAAMLSMMGLASPCTEQGIAVIGHFVDAITTTYGTTIVMLVGFLPTW